jgi:hypothetical protein
MTGVLADVGILWLDLMIEELRESPFPICHEYWNHDGKVSTQKQVEK